MFLDFGFHLNMFRNTCVNSVVCNMYGFLMKTPPFLTQHSVENEQLTKHHNCTAVDHPFFFFFFFHFVDWVSGGGQFGSVQLFCILR